MKTGSPREQEDRGFNWTSGGGGGRSGLGGRLDRVLNCTCEGGGVEGQVNRAYQESGFKL